MGKSKKGGLINRRRNALALLEKQYEAFKKAGVNKEPYYTTRNGKKHYHKGRTFAEECNRMSSEIKILKDKINRNVS